MTYFDCFRKSVNRPWIKEFDKAMTLGRSALLSNPKRP